MARTGDYRWCDTHGDSWYAFGRRAAAGRVCGLRGISARRRHLSAQAFGFARVAKWVAPLIVVALAGIASWIGFAPGERECASSFSFFGLGSSGVASCNPAFAIAAILIWVFFGAVLWFNYLRKPPKN